MKLRLSARAVPGRIATGAYVLHAGIEKWGAPSERAEGLHAMASGAFPFLKDFPPARFAKALAAGELLTGAALLIPVVGDKAAGAALTAFSGALLAMYWKTPALRRSGSVWPTPAGMAVSKDVCMLGIGLGLLAD